MDNLFNKMELAVDSFVEQFVTGLQKTGEKVGKRINKIKKSVNSEK